MGVAEAVATGVAVAKLAGVPQPVIAAARRYLAALEAQRDARAEAAAMPQGSLPFGPTGLPEHESAHPADALRERLQNVDPDALSPREAHELLYSLKKLLDLS